MLEQLIESRSHAEENAKRGGFLMATFFVAAIMLSSGILWSLFAKDIAMGNDNLEISTMVAPVPENAPPVPLKIEDKRIQPQIEKVAAPTRQFNIARIDETQPAPTAISVSPNTHKARPIGDFIITDGRELDPQGAVSAKVGRETTIGVGIGPNNETAQTEILEKPAAPPPIIPKKAEESPRKSPPTVSLGVITGKATNLPKPIYSAAARAVNAGGDVNVQVLIDEKGNVVSAKAVNGHPLLRESAERAARTAKFTPTVLSKQPVKVTGIIVYKFLK